ncbi:unnamed protein product [Owenia fusiformis]|uniref:Uncharacterized protein n=1 Tax=Owenia fusiformis TaxID=6347 RepID=A0A8J1Y8A4_OWEFU|nr:unnamed protein product [Owenia fusiformis]
MGKIRNNVLVIAVSMVLVAAEDGYIGKWRNKHCAKAPMDPPCPQLTEGQQCGICIVRRKKRKMDGNCLGDLHCSCSDMVSGPVAGKNGRKRTAHCANYAYAEHDIQHALPSPTSYTTISATIFSMHDA